MAQLFFSNLNHNYSNLSYLRNLQKQFKEALNFKKISQSLEQFILTAGQNNSGNKIPLLASKLFA
mgnify:CR=1 FL=1